MKNIYNHNVLYKKIIGTKSIENKINIIYIKIEN